MQLLFLLVQRLNCSFLLTSCYSADKVKGIPLPHQGDEKDIDMGGTKLSVRIGI